MMYARRASALGALVAGMVSMVAQGAAPAVVQRGYDANVSGATLTETTLNTANVGPNAFGRLYELSLDSNPYAQPLYVPNVVIPGLGAHNVLYVATMNDSIYAFDADVGGAPLWTFNLASFFSTTAVTWANYNFPPIKNPGNLGILSTPVIDPSTHVMYVVACTQENGTMAYRLHAVDITDGSEPYGPGVLIAGNRAGATFDARFLTQRTSLVLAKNQVIIAFGGMQSETAQPYTGWVMSYDELTLRQTGSFNTVTANSGGGVWQSGRPPAVDAAGDVYVLVGNSAGSAGYDGSTSFSESLVKLDPSQGLALIDWFTPSNWSYLDSHDLDSSGSGPMLIPGTTLIAGGGKSGVLYLLDSTNLGKFVPKDTQVVQEQSITSRIASGPVFWNRAPANGGPLMYDWGFNDVLKAYPFSGVFAGSPSSVGTATMAYPGPVLALSANADQHGSGLLWATTQDPNTKDGVLHAYDAENIASELWNSQMIPSRDGYGTFANYVPPLVANGKVYVASFYPGVINAYGLLQYTVQPTSLAFGSIAQNTVSAPLLVTLTNGGTTALPITSIALAGANRALFSQTNTCGGSVPAATACSIKVVFAPTSGGSKTATLNVNAGGGAGTQTVALSGTGLTSAYTLSPTALAFGSIAKGTVSAPLAVTLTNGGSTALPITSIALAGTNRALFSQTNTCGSSVPAATACSIKVVFAPTSGGSKTATLNVNAGGGAGTQTVALSGTGMTSAYTLSPTSLAFGSIAKNSVSASLSLTVMNGGSTALPITSIALAGANRSQFVQTNTCGSSVPGNASCTINVKFAPTSTGSKAATLNVSAAGNTQNATLGGSGN